MASSLTDLLRLVLVASWQSSLIILLILLVRSLMGASIPARWRSLLWVLVLVRLIVPISAFPSNPVSMQNIAVVDHPLDQVTFVLPQPHETESLGDRIPLVPELAQPTPAPRPSFSIPWWTVATTIWSAGMLISLGIIISAQVMLRRRLGKNRLPVDPAVSAIWNKCCERLRIKRSPVLRASADVHSPALVGLFRPILLLPEGKLSGFSAEDWENVFVHELAHFQRAALLGNLPDVNFSWRKKRN
ncbi:MAG TPA: M56 family metallopeptidase [Candidatus Methylacidiphilales bacterium]